MRYLSLFSGIEAASVAWRPLGWKCVGVAEIEPFPCSILKHYYPEVPNLGDITKITEQQIQQLGPIDLIVGGFPCQDLSIAGKRKGLKHADGTNTRSGLFYDAMRIVRWAKPRWTVIENVPGLFSSNEGGDFASVVGELAGCELSVPGDGWRGAGVALGQDGLVEWATLDAQYFGVPQRRRRVFLVRDTGDWANRPPLFLVRESMCGNPPPSRKSRERIAPPVNAGLGRSSANDFAENGGPVEVSKCLKANHCGIDREDGHTVIPIQEIGKRQSGTAMNGVGHGKPGDPMYTLQSSAVHGVCQPCAQDVTGPITAGISKGMRGSEGVDSNWMVPEIEGTLNFKVRRLTVTECEFLQGFPRDYTLIQVRGKPASDNPRYKALGNSMAVPCMVFIGKRIQEVQKL